MTLFARRVILVAAMAVGGAGCDENLTDLAGPSPNLKPTLASIQQEIFSTTDSSGRLACTRCHSDAGRAPDGNLVLLDGRAHASLVGVRSRFKPGAILVVPGDPENSYLIHKIEGRPDIVGQRMPRTAGPFLTEGQIRIIRRWIELGAKND